MIQKTLAGLVLGWTMLAAGSAFAGGCPAHYVDGRLPEIHNPKLAKATTELCYGVFGVMHSGITRTPLWSAERLRPENLALAKKLSRDDSFHSEERLSPAQRAELSDYARSGFDRGHMAPNGDMPDRRTQHESFTLANMVPQDSENNRHLWAGLEGRVRDMVKKEGTLYVITGPAFIGGRLQKVGNVLVPSHLYKAVYSPSQKAGAAWLVENRATDELDVMTIAELEDKIGINLMPSLSARQKSAMLDLPRPKQKKSRHWPF
ncbi:DNA/RNA non-specific endonuclease [Massilia sp. P8910]|uniref:Endonuclease n=1 Tax=Massilia antarctica TaxID=2765360 RepID=A0AA49A759_9BURK|nr:MULTISPECIES: DNA/RNA non-specific endonuclease [Massilia]CUI02709.1 DNA/RNA non-specific endonuclease [Janthinobacterium sp. CG23_2]MCE3608146.1 DNA/RNA non-specific endonuclease [Massilia antarctica]MCY0910197.1 DNA/RNA non-specific endonuclease [Massilia sp. H27-R4]QPI48422.1 DNA/RNA non-specific endonuclease [Massilia antarctica]CUU26495.1 DNA/RNA non-specific endonuclease [Janthinobacterium sp. CG23_2]